MPNPVERNFRSVRHHETLARAQEMLSDIGSRMNELSDVLYEVARSESGRDMAGRCLRAPHLATSEFCDIIKSIKRLIPVTEVTDSRSES